MKNIISTEYISLSGISTIPSVTEIESVRSKIIRGLIIKHTVSPCERFTITGLNLLIVFLWMESIAVHLSLRVSSLQWSMDTAFFKNCIIAIRHTNKVKRCSKNQFLVVRNSIEEDRYNTGGMRMHSRGLQYIKY